MSECAVNGGLGSRQDPCHVGCSCGGGYGTVVHMVQLATGGWDPYPLLPRWLAAYFLLA